MSSSNAGSKPDLPGWLLTEARNAWGRVDLPLSSQQEDFARAWFADPRRDASQAAAAAGYSAQTARSTGSRLLRHRGIRVLLLQLAARVVETTAIDAAWLLNRLAELAEVDLADLVDEHGAVKSIVDMPEAARRLIQGIEVRELWEGVGAQRHLVGQVTKLKLADRVRVLELIGRHVDVQAWQDNVAIRDADALVERINAGRQRVLEAHFVPERAGVGTGPTPDVDGLTHPPPLLPPSVPDPDPEG